MCSGRVADLRRDYIVLRYEGRRKETIGDSARTVHGRPAAQRTSLLRCRLQRQRQIAPAALRSGTGQGQGTWTRLLAHGRRPSAPAPAP